MPDLLSTTAPATQHHRPHPAPRLEYGQNAEGRFLLSDGHVMAIITGVTGLEAQRFGDFLAAAPELADACHLALAYLDSAPDLSRARTERSGEARKRLCLVRLTLIAALAKSGIDAPSSTVFDHDLAAD